MKQHTWVWNEADCWNSRAPERRNCVLINMELEGVCNLLRALWEKNSHISKEITLAFPAIKTESYLKQLLLLGQFHIYGALLVKSPQSTPQRRFILYWHTWLHNCEKDTFFFIYTEWHLFYRNCEISPCCFTPLLLLAICEVQHRVLPQAVPFVRSKCCLMTNDFLS